MLWVLSGILLPYPLNFNVNSENYTMWKMLNTNPSGVTYLFNELSLFMRYIPAHSKSLVTLLPEAMCDKHFSTDKMEWEYTTKTNLRSVAFKTPDGDYVIFVENREGVNSNQVKINLPTNEALTFNKFSIGNKNDLSKPAKLAKMDREILAENGYFIDTIDNDYKLTLYTTQKPYPQVICDEDIIYLKAGESAKITYSIFDNKSKRIKSAILEGKKAVSLNRTTVTVKENAKEGDMAAIKISLADNPDSYSVVLVKVVE